MAKTKVIPAKAHLIPKEAKCVFKGHIYDTYQWQLKMFDGSIGDFEMLKRPDASQVIAIKGGKIVIMKQLQPHWKSYRYTLPGGRAEADEDSLTTVKRELLEETGLTFKTWKLLNVTQISEKIEYFIYTYLATDFESETTTEHDKGEKMETVYMEPSEVQQAAMDEPRLLEIIKFKSIDELLSAPEFQGREVEI